MLKFLVLLISISVVGFSKDASPKYGWIDMQRSLISVKEGKRILKKLEKEVATNKKELDKEQIAFQKEREEFEKKSLVMNDDKKKEKQIELQGKVYKLQEKMMRYQQELQLKQSKASQEIIKKIADLVQDYAKKSGYTYIFEKNALIFKPEGDDITEKIIALYDKKHK